MKPNKIDKPIPVAEYKRQVSKKSTAESNNKESRQEAIKNISRKAVVEPGNVHAAKRVYTGGDFLPGTIISDDASRKNILKSSVSDPREKTMDDPSSDDPNERKSQDDSNPSKNDPTTERGLK
jgi:hypothetical protein